MKNKKKKLFVCTVLKNDEQGSTFISMLMALVIIIITMPLIIHFLTHIHASKFNDDLSIQQFYIFLRNDVLTADHVYSNENNLYFYLPTDEIAKIEQYQNMIRRRVDEKGHEIYLRNIDSFTLHPLSYGTKVVIISEEGEMYEKTIVHYE